MRLPVHQGSQRKRRGRRKSSGLEDYVAARVGERWARDDVEFLRALERVAQARAHRL